MVLAVMFRIKNDTFTERLRTVIQDDETTQTILKKNESGRRQRIYLKR